MVVELTEVISHLIHISVVIFDCILVKFKLSHIFENKSIEVLFHALNLSIELPDGAVEAPVLRLLVLVVLLDLLEGALELHLLFLHGGFFLF